MSGVGRLGLCCSLSSSVYPSSSSGFSSIGVGCHPPGKLGPNDSLCSFVSSDASRPMPVHLIGIGMSYIEFDPLENAESRKAFGPRRGIVPVGESIATGDFTSTDAAGICSSKGAGCGDGDGECEREPRNGGVCSLFLWLDGVRDLVPFSGTSRGSCSSASALWPKGDVE